MLPNNEVRVPRPRFAQSAPRDITAEFTKAASSKHIAPAALIQCLTIFSLAELNTGQLVKDETFTLFEAVGALEVRRLPHLM